MSRAARALLAALALSLAAPVMPSAAQPIPLAATAMAVPTLGREVLARSPRNGENSLKRREEAAAADERDDDEGDSAPFIVVVRHSDGRTCGAALVSARTALSSAECARAPPGAAVAAGARRVLRVAYAVAEEEAGGGSGGGVAGDPWAGALGDLALLELEAAPARARSILMATAAGECEAPAVCQVARDAGPRLRVVAARLDDGGQCATRGPRWPGLRARTLCLAGPELCQSDRGTGVVCGGKLCGVLSRSAGAGAGGRGLCGDVHAAPSLPRWRRFLHCAHTRGACGRDGDCAQLCRESWLPDAAPNATTAGAGGAARDRSVPTDRPPSTENGEDPASAVTRAAPSAEAALGGGAARRITVEFETNRADFGMSPARTTRVFLKAGEYGASAAAAPPTTETGGADAEPEARVSGAAAARAAALPARLRPGRGICVAAVLFFCFLI